MLVAARTACVSLVIGSMADAGLRLPTRSVPPALVTVGRGAASALTSPNRPSSGTDMPTAVPRRKSSRREISPARYSSM